MRSSVWVMLLAATVGLTGCIGLGDDVDTQSAEGTDALNIEPAAEQLFEEPGSNVHPAFGLPTYTTIPTDLPEGAPSFWAPIEENEFSLDNIQVEHLAENPDGDVASGSGIAAWGEIVVVPGRTGQSAWVVSIADPAEPEVLSAFDAGGEEADTGGRDVEILGFPDGSLFAVFATDHAIVPIWDITDPENPVQASVIAPDRGSHNVQIVPGTPLLYNSAGAGGGEMGNLPDGGTEGTAIYDLSDPYAPELALDFDNGYSCHDIKFSLWPSEDKYRAYCAGYDVTQIWDIEDPLDPQVIVNVPVHHGIEGLPSTSSTPERFSHLAMSNMDGTVLIVGDETGGGGLPACDVQASQGPITATGPLGNLYFYDISDETNPLFMGALSTDHPVLMEDILENPDRAEASCTAHFGQLIPAEDRDVLAIAFYGPGVVLVDFTDPRNPQIIERWGGGDTTTWDVWFYNGYLITGDITRGMDILALT